MKRRHTLGAKRPHKSLHFVVGLEIVEPIKRPFHQRALGEPLLFPVFLLCGGKKRGDHDITSSAGIFEVLVGLCESLLLNLVRRRVRRIQNDGSIAQNQFQFFLEVFAEEILLWTFTPIKIADLACRETDQRIS